jgi:oligosaccharide reducing-end xylanase
MPPFRLLPFLVALAVTAGAAAPVPFAPARVPNLFSTLLGKSEAELDAKLANAWRQFTTGDERTERLVYPVAGDLAYVPDVYSRDVRTEGLSYVMMIAVQLDHQREFDQVWRWAKTHHYHESGPLRGYFAWHTDFQGRPLDAGPASDGEEWFVTALFFAAHRWGSRPAPGDYEAEAQALLHTMLHKGEETGAAGVTGMFDRAAQQVVFVPHGEGARFTDPSYHLPAFYELWARWAAAEEDRGFWRAAAGASRALFRRAADPRTGLMPDYAEFDGRPRVRGGHEDFRYDAWRTLSNPALDYAWFAADPWTVAQSNRVLRFLAAQGPLCPDRFRLDGTPVSTDVNSAGLIAMAATAGLAADPDVARPFVARLWELEIPRGQFRYYNGLLYLLGLLETGGRFRSYAPPAHP